MKVKRPMVFWGALGKVRALKVYCIVSFEEKRMISLITQQKNKKNSPPRVFPVLERQFL
jgi:hypothetical protein